jgi:hypothetical protein
MYCSWVGVTLNLIKCNDPQCGFIIYYYLLIYTDNNTTLMYFIILYYIRLWQLQHMFLQIQLDFIISKHGFIN